MALVPYALARPFLFGLDAEAAHDLTLGALARIQHTPLVRCIAQARVEDPVTLAGLRFPNRIGLAAGLDKNGRCIDGLAAMGFGFIEVGTVTPKAQPGNPKPRMFRLPEANALINRLGFNNDGLEAFLANVKRASFRASGGVLGLNIGKNAATPIERAVDDYLLGLDGVYPHADYVAVNISSPNTKNLRALQSDEALDALLSAVQQRKALLAKRHGRQVPVFVKIAPDLDEAQVKVIAATLKKNGIDGVIATNTTIARDAVGHLPHGDETGGLSGAPVFEASNRVIRQLRAELGSGYPIIGVGGVMSGADARSQARSRCRPGSDLHRLHLPGPAADHRSGAGPEGDGLRTTAAAPRSWTEPLRASRPARARRPSARAASRRARHRSVMMRSTTPTPVSGSVQAGRIFRSMLPSFFFATCSISTTTLFTPPTRSIAPPMPLTILPGIIQLARSPFSLTCMAPRMDRLILPPRIIAKLSWLPKMLEPGMVVTVCLPALMRSASTSSSSRERADAQHAVLALQPDLDVRVDEVGHQRGQADAEVHVEAVGEFLGGARGHLVVGPGHGQIPSFAGMRSVIVRFSMRFSGLALSTMRCT